MANNKLKRLRSQNRLTGRFETGGITNFSIGSATNLGDSGSNSYYRVTSNTTVNWQVVNATGYVSRRDSNVIGNSTRVQDRVSSIEFFIAAGGGGGYHGGGGGGGWSGNGPITPSPTRNNVLTEPQFSFIKSFNVISPTSKNATGGSVGFTSTYSQSISIGAGGGSGASGGNTTFFNLTAVGGGSGGAAGTPGNPGGCGGGAGNNGSPGSGSIGGSGGGYSSPNPAPSSTGGGGGGMGGSGSSGTGGPGITITLPTPQALGGGGAGGGGITVPAFCQGSQRPDGYCYGTFVPGAAPAPGSPGGSGGGAANSNATLYSAGGGGYGSNGSSTTSGTGGAAWFVVNKNIVR